MGQAMLMYVGEYKGAIPGSGATSGRGMFNDNYTEYPVAQLPPDGPIYPMDYFQPLAKMMRMKLKDLPTFDPATRYTEYMSLKNFICPSFQDTVAPPFAGSPNAGVLQSISYATAFGFLLTSGSPTAGSTGATRISTGGTYPALPSGYTPKINKIGTGSEKIFAADGGKFANSTNQLDYNLTFPAPNGYTTTNFGNISNYSDFGPFNMMTSSYDRSWARGNTKTGTYDPRRLAFRHGGRDRNFRLNVVFYDGHGETMDELVAANPKYWLPKGTAFTGSTQTNVVSKIWPDVIAQYGITAQYVVP